jgi:hypothetical protein
MKGLFYGVTVFLRTIRVTLSEVIPTACRYSFSGGAAQSRDKGHVLRALLSLPLPEYF